MLAGLTEEDTMRRFTLLLIVALALVVASGAWGHTAGPHKITLTPGTSSSVRQTTFTGHSGFDLRVTAYFGTVNTHCAFLRYMNFYIYNIQPSGMGGGKAYLWNTSVKLAYTADAGRFYYSASTYRLDVSRWFCGGYGSADHAAVTLEKNNVGGCWNDCDAHRSQATFYVP
jgi:hypothetical protein